MCYAESLADQADVVAVWLGGSCGRALGSTPGPWAAAGPEEDRIIQAAKKLKPAELNGMIWSLYYGGPMQKQQQEFKKLTGIGVREIQDIPTPQIPQRTMAEAIAHADTFDFFHIDLTMIPWLVSAGLLEPLDGYMAEVGYKIDMAGNSSHFMRYNGKMYGLPTDGNVFIQLFRKDLFESPDEQKAFTDTYGRPLAWP